MTAITFERKYKTASRLYVQAVYRGQVVAEGDCRQPDGHTKARQLLALSPTLHRLTNWLLRQNVDRRKKELVWRGALLVIGGSVEPIDRQHPHWRNGDFDGEWTQGIKGRIVGAGHNHLIQGWKPDDWSCRCQNVTWLPVSRLPINGIRKPDCCRHEAAWWLAGQLVKRGAGQQVAGSGCSLGYNRIVPTPSVLPLLGQPVAKAAPYLVWRVAGQTVGSAYQPVSYCLVRPFGDGTAGVVVESSNPGWQWRRGIDKLLELAATLNAEMNEPQYQE
jgi:hypothetical protein